MTNEELARKDGETLEQFKARITEKTRELKAEEKAQPVSEPAQTPTNEPPVQPDPAPVATAVEPTDKPQEAAPSSSAEATPVPSQDDKAEDKPEIAKKKGWKDVDAFLKSYRELEKKLGEKRPPEPPQVTQIPPNYGMPNYGYPVQPVPMPYVAPRNGMADLAQKYNIPPEDFERILPLVGDLSQSIVKREVEELRGQFLNAERERQKERELERLKQDPAFQNPEVLSEMGSILDSAPQLLREQNGLTYAFKEALATVGRKRLEGSVPTTENASQPSGTALPTKPPTTARGTGPATVARPGIKAPIQMDPATFAALPRTEKQKVLRSMGALRD